MLCSRWFRGERLTLAVLRCSPLPKFNGMSQLIVLRLPRVITKAQKDGNLYEEIVFSFASTV